jgi:hypothetical protein
VAETQRWQRRPDDVAFVDDGADRVAMVDLLRLADPPIVLEGTSAAIWRLLETPRTIAEMVDELTAVYDAPRGDIEVGVEAFVADLVTRGLAVHPSNVA